MKPEGKAAVTWKLRKSGDASDGRFRGCGEKNPGLQVPQAKEVIYFLARAACRRLD